MPGYKFLEQSAYVCLLVHAAWPQQGKYQPLALGLEDEQRHIAVLAIIVVEQCQLLCAVGIGIAVVKSEDNPVLLLFIGGYEVVDEQIPDIPKLPMGEMVFQTGHRGL